MSNVGVTDAPLLSMDEDLFSVKPYVTGLSSFINTCETPMTISIQGDWGSGKTSMMNMIKEICLIPSGLSGSIHGSSPNSAWVMAWPSP